jgi:hypothetical protein
MDMPYMTCNILSHPEKIPNISVYTNVPSLTIEQSNKNPVWGILEKSNAFFCRKKFGRLALPSRDHPGQSGCRGCIIDFRLFGYIYALSCRLLLPERFSNGGKYISGDNKKLHRMV